MIDSLFLYCLSIWFFFFLFNYAEITKPYAIALKEMLGPRWGYPLGCAFCWSFHLTWFLALVGSVPASYILVAPVLHLFIDCLYSKLGCGETESVTIDLESINQRVFDNQQPPQGSVTLP